MLDAFMRRFWRGLLVMFVAVTALVSPTGRAEALAGNKFLSQSLGTCRVILDVRSKVGYVYLEDRMQMAGGSYFDGVGISFVFPAITLQSLTNCGITDVSNLQQTGASGDFDSTAYIGFSFRGRESGVLYDYEYALVGATNTQAVANRTVVNAAPTADAGVPQTVDSGDTVNLSGTAGDADGDTLTYNWTAPTGIVLTGSDTLTPSFVAPTLALNAPDRTITATLTVSDGTVDVVDTVDIIIQSKKNAAPELEPSFTKDGGSVTLLANATDADGDSLSYEWMQTSGPETALSGADEASATFTLPTIPWNNPPQTLVFEVQVTDENGATTTESVSVTATPSVRGDLAVEVGSDRNVRSGSFVDLTPLSLQTDGTSVLSFVWSSETVEIVNATSQDAFFIAPAVTVATPIVITLEVTESAGVMPSLAIVPDAPAERTVTDSFTVTVVPDEETVINVVAPSSVIEGDEVVLDASGSSDGDDKFMIVWTQTEGPDVLDETALVKAVKAAAPAEVQADAMPVEGVFSPVVNFVAPQVPEGETELALGFLVTVYTGREQRASQEVTVTVKRAGPTAEETEAAINDFVQARMNSLIGMQPDLASIVSGGDGTANLTVSSMGGEVDLSTAPDQPYWLRIKGNWSTIAGAEGDYVLGAAGAHVKVNEGLALGVMAQVDHMKTVDGVSVIEGTGYLLGPYVVAKLPDQPLTVQGRLLYGMASNDYAPLGTFVDSFDSTRLLASVGVSGQIAKGDVIWKPSLQAAYAREETEAYTDGLGTAISAGTNAVAQVAAGLEVTFALPVPSGGLTATLGVSDIWSGSVQGPAAAFEGHRGKVSAGVNRSFASGAQLSLTTSYDGLGTKDYESIGLDLLFQHKF